MADKYCIASGLYSDTNIWSLTPDGVGGAGAPGNGEDIYFHRSVTVERFASPAAYEQNIFVVAGVDCSIQPSAVGVFSLAGNSKLVIDGTLRLTDSLAATKNIPLNGSSEVHIGENGNLYLNLPNMAFRWFFHRELTNSAPFVNRGRIIGNAPGQAAIRNYYGTNPDEMFMPGRIESNILEVRSAGVLAEGESRYRTLTGPADLDRCRFHSSYAGTYVTRLQSADMKIGALDFMINSSKASFILEQACRLLLSGDMAVSSDSGAIQWNQLAGSESVFCGTADQVIKMPKNVSGQHWFVDKPAGSLDLTRFDGFLQGRLRSLIVRAAASIDLSGPSPCLLNSTNEPACFYGLKADASSTDMLHTFHDDGKHEAEAMDSCVNYGQITIPRGKVLCCKIFDNQTGASVLGDGILCVEYGGLTNLGSIDSTVSVQYFNVPRSFELTLTPSTGPTPLTVTALAESDCGVLHTFHWGNGHLTGPVEADSARYTYREPGLYTVTATVTDPAGTTLSTSRPVTVLPPPPPPQVRMAISPDQGELPLEVELSTEGSEGADMSIDWGDGSVLYGPAGRIVPLVPHVYERAGRFLAKLTIWNSLGDFVNASQVVTVRDTEAIRAEMVLLPSAGEAPLTILADASESHGDEFLFVWGDGTSDGPQSEPRATHTFLRPGYYSVTLTTGKAGLTASAVRGVTVFLAAPLPPTTIAPSPLGPLEHEAKEKHYGIPRGNMPSLYRYTLAQGICYMNDTIRLFCPMTRAGRALHDGSALFLGRVAHADGSPVLPGEIDSAHYSIHRLDQSDPTVRTPVEGHTEIPLTVSEILLPETITDENWPFDETGYNFRYALDDGVHSPFPVPGRHYLVSFVLAPTDASPKIRFEYRVHVV